MYSGLFLDIFKGYFVYFLILDLRTPLKVIAEGVETQEQKKFLIKKLKK